MDLIDITIQYLIFQAISNVKGVPASVSNKLIEI